MTPTTRSNSQKNTEGRTHTSNERDDSTPITKHNKRAHSPDSAANENKTKKKNRTNNMAPADLDELKNLISASSDKIERKIETSQNSLDAKITSLAEKVQNEVSTLKTSVAELHTKINEELVDVKKQLSQFSERIDNDDDFQRTQRNHDLRITGFPFKENENLVAIFTQIATAIGFNMGPHTVMPEIERMLLFNKTVNTKEHFAILRHKQQFYTLYMGKMPLEPTQFGLDKNNRITIGENLTKLNAKIFKHALSMKKNNKIAQAFTENGIVKIKFAKSKTETAHTVRSITTLESIIAQYHHSVQSSNNVNVDATTAESSVPARATVAPVSNNNTMVNTDGVQMDTNTTA